MIHPTIVKKAEKLGLIGQELKSPEGAVEFFWPSKNIRAYGIGSKPAMAEAEAVMEIARMDPDWRIVNKPDDPFLVQLFNKDRSRVFIREGATPQDTLAELNGDKGEREWLTTTVPDDGGEAFKQGFVAGDNPYEDAEEGDNSDAAQWDAAFDEAADAAEAEGDEEEGASGSVVKPEYRIRYAEAGHPNHCGDWLAVILNNLILGKTTTDIEHFEELCNLNGVTLEKYKREGNGWQGRLRMTGRNLLVKPIVASGVLKVPHAIQQDGVTEYRAPAEWVQAKSGKKGVAVPTTDTVTTKLPEDQQVADIPTATQVEEQLAAEAPSVQEQMARRRSASKNKH